MSNLRAGATFLYDEEGKGVELPPQCTKSLGFVDREFIEKVIESGEVEVIRLVLEGQSKLAEREGK